MVKCKILIIINKEMPEEFSALQQKFILSDEVDKKSQILKSPGKI